MVLRRLYSVHYPRPCSYFCWYCNPGWCLSVASLFVEMFPKQDMGDMIDFRNLVLFKCKFSWSLRTCRKSSPPPIPYICWSECGDEIGLELFYLNFNRCKHFHENAFEYYYDFFVVLLFVWRCVFREPRGVVQNFRTSRISWFRVRAYFFGDSVEYVR